MRIAARVSNWPDNHSAMVRSGERVHALQIEPAEDGGGSLTNGGELLFLALATCYCNDVYREAASRGLEIVGVEVQVEGKLGGPGEPARDVVYSARVEARGTTVEEVRELLAETDRLAEIQNTLRQGVEVRLTSAEVDLVD